jgi:hypothetical protein
MATKRDDDVSMEPRRWHTEESETHDRHGRFKPGNRAGLKISIANRWKILDESVYDNESQYVLDVLRAMREKALDGDERAARLWLERVAGKPREAPDRAPVEIAPQDIDAVRTTLIRAVGREAASLAATAQERALTVDEAAQAVSYLRALLPQVSAEADAVRSMSDQELLTQVEAELAKHKEAQ